MIPQMDRERLKGSWVKYYGMFDAEEVMGRLQMRADFIVGKMMMLARRKGPLYHEIPRIRLMTALGMSLGIHRQLLGRLTSSPRRGNLKGGGRARL